MALTDVLNVTDSAGYFEPMFRKVLEEHLKIIKEQSNLTTVTITPIQALRYKGDFYGLLNELGVPDYLKWITLRVNDMISPSDANSDISMVVMIDPQYIRRIYNTHRTQMKVKIKR